MISSISYNQNPICLFKIFILNQNNLFLFFFEIKKFLCHKFYFKLVKNIFKILRNQKINSEILKFEIRSLTKLKPYILCILYALEQQSFSFIGEAVLLFALLELTDNYQISKKKSASFNATTFLFSSHDSLLHHSSLIISSSHWSSKSLFARLLFDVSLFIRFFSNSTKYANVNDALIL